MLTITLQEICAVLRDYGIEPECVSFSELERYDYEQDDADSKQVRLIVRADLANGRSLVLRFKNEEDAPPDVIEAQSRFAALLFAHGIETPKAYSFDGHFAHSYSFNGYDVVVTVESFEDGEIRSVDPKTAEETGALLAAMHNIAEQADFHVNSEVLFDPMTENDLFSFDAFNRHKDALLAVDSDLYHAIVRQHAALVSRIAPLGKGPRYAVQGDISDCNLYRTKDGRLGVFDFNRCGDNQLYFDAVMQAVFEARLMDYPEDLSGDREAIILSAFLEGYLKIRPFTAEQTAAFPYLYVLIDAFWSGDNRSLTKAVKEADRAAIHQWMQEIFRRETALRQPPWPHSGF